MSAQTYDAIAHVYEIAFGDYSEDIALYREMARRSGGPVLEAMCGSGRMLLPLAAAGHTLTGIDSSQAMLDIAHQRLEAAGTRQQVTLLQGDICTAELPAAAFALAFVAVNSFMHLERVKDQLGALSSLRQALQPDGLLILDLFNPDPLRMANEDNRLVFERAYEHAGRRLLKFSASENDLAAQINTTTYLLDEMDAEGRVMRQVVCFRLRWFYRYELEHLLARAGFRVRHIYGSYDLDDYSSESERLIAIASPRRGE